MSQNTNDIVSPVAEAARMLERGAVGAFPTETVYGLGADAANGLATARIFELKGRPRFNPLIVHVLDIEAARTIAEMDAAALQLAETFWPGPLTIVLPVKAGARLSALVTAGLDTVAIRVPSHPLARELMKRSKLALAAPSANVSGSVSPTLASHVRDDFGESLDFVIDGGAATAGIESTIVSLNPQPQLLRPGAIARDALEKALGISLRPTAVHGVVQAPGHLASHYAPRATLKLNAERALTGETLLAFGPMAPSEALNLSRAGNLREAAANLFAFLR